MPFCCLSTCAIFIGNHVMKETPVFKVVLVASSMGLRCQDQGMSCAKEHCCQSVRPGFRSTKAVMLACRCCSMLTQPSTWA